MSLIASPNIFALWFRDGEIIKGGVGGKSPTPIASHATNPLSGIAEALSRWWLLAT